MNYFIEFNNDEQKNSTKMFQQKINQTNKKNKTKKFQINQCEMKTKIKNLNSTIFSIRQNFQMKLRKQKSLNHIKSNQLSQTQFFKQLSILIYF